ncbi:MAG: glycosyltransferase family 2 protein [Candidatus Gracilibacteria bacterium]|jgi:glycosyltransferase involved in cell wall biosynthesis
MAPFLSVIIPTYNRAEKLEKCLHALREQSLASESFEVLVVDDGSTDSTPKVLERWAKDWNNIKHLHQENAGQGNARNKALRQAQGQVILFIGDDIYGSPDFLLKHTEFHREHPEKEFACLGLTEWDPSQEITPFMEWLTHGGPQFAYHHLKPMEEVSFWYFYTSNISIKKDLLEKESFDPDFKVYGWEDIELGYRLSQRGMKLMYKPEALAHHDHFMSEDSLKDRAFKIGKSAVLFQKKQPAVPVLPSGLKKSVLTVLSSKPILALSFLLKTIFPPLKKMHWFLINKHYFLQGIRSI